MNGMFSAVLAGSVQLRPVIVVKVVFVVVKSDVTRNTLLLTVINEPACSNPVPLPESVRLTLLSVPDDPMVTVAGLAVAALVTVIESTALAVALEVMNGFPFASLMAVTLGVVSVGLVASTTPPLLPVVPFDRFAAEGCEQFALPLVAM